MIIANGEETGITHADLPAVWNIDLWQDPIHVRQLAAEAETVACTAAALNSRNGRINRLQLADNRGTILVASREPQELLDGASDRAIRVRTAAEVAGGRLTIAGRHEWLRHPRLIGDVKLAEKARASWVKGIAFIAEDAANKRPGLRPPQIGALHAIAAHWSVSQVPALVVMPTGTGKTEVMLAAMVMHRPQRLLVVVPSDLLRQQTFDKFTKLGVLRAAAVIDPDVVLPVVGGLFGTPQADDLAKLERCNVVIATMAALAALGVMQLQKFLSLFDMVFFDEAHHVPAVYYLVYMSEKGDVVANHTETKRLLDLARLACKDRPEPMPAVYQPFNKATKDGRHMEAYSELLGQAIRSMVIHKEEKDIDSLFTGGRTSALVDPIRGLDDFELVAFLVVFDGVSTDGGTTRRVIETLLKKRGVKVTSQMIYEIMERDGI